MPLCRYALCLMSGLISAFRGLHTGVSGWHERLHNRAYRGRLPHLSHSRAVHHSLWSQKTLCRLMPYAGPYALCLMPYALRLMWGLILCIRKRTAVRQGENQTPPSQLRRAGVTLGTGFNSLVPHDVTHCDWHLPGHCPLRGRVHTELCLSVFSASWNEVRALGYGHGSPDKTELRVSQGPPPKGN